YPILDRRVLLVFILSGEVDLDDRSGDVPAHELEWFGEWLKREGRAQYRMSLDQNIDGRLQCIHVPGWRAQAEAENIVVRAALARQIAVKQHSRLQTREH